MKAILTYHSVDDSGSVISVTPEELARTLDALASRRVNIVSLQSLSGVPEGTDAAAITFDDGFANFTSSAAPVLSSRGLPATVFVVPAHVGTSNVWEASDSRFPVPRLPLMSWDEIGNARDAGFEIGGHGMTHRSLSGLSDELLRAEVDDCIASIQRHVGIAPKSFAFPYGDHDRAALEAVGQRFACVCTTRLDVIGEADPPSAMPRLDMFYFRGNEILSHWGSPRFRMYLAARQAGRALRGAIRSGNRATAH